MGEQQSRLRESVWCQNSCKNCMAGDIDNAAVQQELKRNGNGTIIPREELQQMLKQQMQLPNAQQPVRQQQQAQQSINENQHPDVRRLQGLDQSAGGNLSLQQTHGTYLNSGNLAEVRQNYIGQGPTTGNYGTTNSRSPDLARDGLIHQQNNLNRQHPYNLNNANNLRSQMSSPGTISPQPGADKFQNQNNLISAQSQLRMAQKAQKENQQPKRVLHLRVLSSAILEKGKVISVNEHGLANIEPHRKAYDGVTFFGCKKTLPKENGDQMAGESGTNALGGSSDGDDSSMVELNDPQKDIVNDFIIPVCKKEDKERHAGRQFQIRYDEHADNYFIKDLQIGYGVFTETVGPVPLKDNLLINMGESYIVTNIHQPDPEMLQEYDLATNNNESYSEPPPKLKLRVFSVSKSEQPDLYCCQFEDQEIVIGRSPNCDIRVDDELLSKMQATIMFDNSLHGWVLIDGYLGKRSTNGTWLYLNEEIPIQSGMLFKSNQTFFQANIDDKPVTGGQNAEYQHMLGKR